MPEQQGPFVASDEKTEDGTPVGVEVAGSRGAGDPAGIEPRAPAHTDAGPIDETGDLDDVGETEAVRPRDTADLDDVPATEDRDLRGPEDRPDSRG
jgi:hypothetical protein